MEYSQIELARFLGNIGGGAVCIIMFFVSIANYIIERRVIRIIECFLFAALTMIFIVRTAAAFKPSMVDLEFAEVSIAVLWVIVVFVALIWGIVLGITKWKSITAQVAVRDLHAQLEREEEKGEKADV